jgi:Ion channel
LQKFPRKDAVRLQCAHVRRRSARFLIRPALRFVAQSPGRACVYLLLGTVIIGGALFSLAEKEGSWIDGMWWAIVTLTTVGYGDYSPATVAGRWVAVFVMAGGLGSVAILTGLLADEIREARIHDRDETPELDDDIEHVIQILEAEMDKLRAKVSHPEVVEALRKVHNETKEEAL